MRRPPMVSIAMPWWQLKAGQSGWSMVVKHYSVSFNANGTGLCLSTWHAVVVGNVWSFRLMKWETCIQRWIPFGANFCWVIWPRNLVLIKRFWISRNASWNFNSSDDDTSISLRETFRYSLMEKVQDCINDINSASFKWLDVCFPSSYFISLSLSLYCFPITCWHGNTCIRTNPHNTYLTIKVSCLEASQTQQTWNLHNVYVSVWSFYTCLFPSQCSPWGGRSILGLTLVAYAYLDGLSIPADANRAVEILQDTAHKGPLSSLPDKIGMLRGAKGRPTHEKM